MNRKIIVSGCSNCPYLTAWNNGEGNGIESIVSGSCGHPSFNNQLLNPHFPSTVFFQYKMEDTDGNRVDFSDVHELKPNGLPKWCPLPIDEQK